MATQRTGEERYVSLLRHERLSAGAAMLTLAGAILWSSSAFPSPLSSDHATTAATPPSDNVVDVATGFEVPWSIAFVGDEVLVSQRDSADILALRPGEQPRSLGKVPNVTARLDGGLLGLAVLETDDRIWIYAYHSTVSDNRIVRMDYRHGVLGEPELVVRGLPGGRGHNGGRIDFGPDGMLYAATGDAQMPALSQDPASLGGKILRMTPEGRAPHDNPVEGSLVYSLGHRNPQGLAWDSDGQLWATEFGDDTWDELNRIVPGGNYGWPMVEGRGGDPAFIDPVGQWHPREMGPSGLADVDGTLVVAGLTGERLWTVARTADRNPVVQAHLTGVYGRIRHVVRGPDDTLWFITNNTDGRGDTPRENDDRLVSIPWSDLAGKKR